jgi:hypothetical protein
MNRLRTNHQAVVVMVVVLMMRHLVLVVLVAVQAATNHHHSPAVVDMVLKLATPPVELNQAMHHQVLKYNNMLLILKVSFKMQTHKSFVAQHPVVFKHTHKTSEFAFFNHHPFHPQA